MQTKLTLRVDNALIEQAKRYAQEHGTSLSQLVADYFTVLVTAGESKTDFKASLPPITRSLSGILKEGAFDPEDYKRYLEEKYL